jgi:hypothetical protein
MNCFGAPRFERVVVCAQVGVYDLGHDVFAQSSCSKDSIEKLELRIFTLCSTRPVSFSSNHDVTVDVTERTDNTTGFSYSW